MTREQIDALLGKLTRFDEVGDFEGSYMLTPTGDGEFVRFDDVREMLEGMIDALPSGRLEEGV